jgi:hypothetical protein
VDVNITFPFRGGTYAASLIFSFDELGCYIFAFLKDQDLISEFGEDITIKTDCKVLLPTLEEYPTLTELSAALFEVIKTLPSFHRAKEKLFDRSIRKTG